MPYPTLGCSSCMGAFSLTPSCSGDATPAVAAHDSSSVTLPKAVVWGAIALLVLLALNRRGGRS